jgi:predicted AlkP superfamily pyrophosphatase or phosphodiesterase
MKRLCYFVFVSLLLIACENPKGDHLAISQSTREKEISTGFLNSEDNYDKSYVVMVSLDGFRYDYVRKFDCPNLNQFQIQAQGIIPSFPSKTFPNHYSIVTGLYPGNHGIISNEFYNRNFNKIYTSSTIEAVREGKWYRGDPLWVLSQEEGMASASMFWVGSEAKINGFYPSYYYAYDESINNEERINTVVNWLTLPKEQRPHFITLYFSDSDNSGHNYGPDSKEMEETAHYLDSLIGDLKNKLDHCGLDVNLLIVSDHGMKEIFPDGLLNIMDYLPSDVDSNAIITSNMPVMIYSSDSTFLMDYYLNLKKEDRILSYYRDSLPEEFNYYAKDPAIGDIVIMPKPGYYITAIKELPKGTSTHGYSVNDCPEMKGIFFASGPAFKDHLTIGPFENVHVYPLIAAILDLEYDSTMIDGRKEILEGILKEEIR